MRRNRKDFFLRGDVEAAFKYARWAPPLAFLTVYVAGGDFSYLTCAVVFSVWPILRMLREI